MTIEDVLKMGAVELTEPSAACKKGVEAHKWLARKEEGEHLMTDD